jgi:hypothetical protein
LGIINPVTMSEKARRTAVMARFARSYWLFGVLLRRRGDTYEWRWIRLLLIHALFPSLALVAGYLDATTHLMAHGGRGVFEHYGFHALFLSAPALVYLLTLVVTALAKEISEPLPWLNPSDKSTKLEEELQEITFCRTAKAKRLLLLLRMVGTVAVVANADSTRHPELVYGQDVFDSSRHALGYLAWRAFLSYYWIYLLPLVTYLAFAAVAVAIRTAAQVDQLPEYDIRCFASDGCGGFKDLGRLMTLVVYLWIPVVVVIIALMETHTNVYATLRISIALALVIPAQLFLPFLRLHRVLTRLKDRKLAALERFLTTSERAIDMKKDAHSAPADERTSLRAMTPYFRLLAGESIYRHTTAMTTWPYIKSDVLRWITPFVPIAMSFAAKRLGLS